jgi:hypothetical protein
LAQAITGSSKLHIDEQFGGIRAREKEKHKHRFLMFTFYSDQKVTWRLMHINRSRRESSG